MLVLALGGGAVMTPECAQIVKEQTFCIYLRASIETLTEHLEDQTMNRPLLNNSERPDCHFERAERDEKSAMRDRITNMMAQRSETYEKTAHIIVDTDGKSIETIASEIASKLKLI
jgi:shikimate kinase